MRALRFIEIGVGLAAAAMIAVVATAPLGSRAADHLDAPNLGSREDADINDVYVFQAATPGRTAIAVTSSYLPSLPVAPTLFHHDYLPRSTARAFTRQLRATYRRVFRLCTVDELYFNFDSIILRWRIADRVIVAPRS